MLDYQHEQHGDRDALKGKTVMYEPNVLRGLDTKHQHDHRLKVLPFGAIKRIRELRLNCKKCKHKKQD